MPPDGGKPGSAYVPQPASWMRAHAMLALDAHYLNMNINELEPLLEPWQVRVRFRVGVRVRVRVRARVRVRVRVRVSW